MKRTLGFSQLLQLFLNQPMKYVKEYQLKMSYIQRRQISYYDLCEHGIILCDRTELSAIMFWKAIIGNEPIGNDSLTKRTVANNKYGYKIVNCTKCNGIGHMTEDHRD